MEVNVRYNEADDAVDSTMLWDTLPVYTDGVNFYLDWTLAGPNESGNPMGLGATNALATSVAIMLFTNQYAANPNGSNDPQGWWGDLVQLDDDYGALGSLLWTLMRGPLNDAVAQQAVTYAKQALQPLVTQGAVASVDVSATYDQVKSTLYLTVSLYSQDGAKAYSQQFSVYWNQVS